MSDKIIDITSISPLPLNVEAWARCRLLHSKIPVWDGDYRQDEITGKQIKNIRWVCAICEKDKEEL